MKILSKSNEIIDLDDIQRDQVYIGNPYAVDQAILIKHNVALLDALESILTLTDIKSDESHLKAEWLYGIRAGFQIFKPNEKKFWQNIHAAVSAAIKNAAGVVD